MSETTVDNRPDPIPATGATPPVAPAARKRAAKKAAKRSVAKKDKVTIFLVGSSHGGKDGDRRQVDATQAEELVRAGAARYPESEEKAHRPAFLS